MNYEDVLPDKWFEVADKRRSSFNNQLLQHLWDEDYMLNICLKCPLFRAYAYGGLLRPDCVFITKCIKEHPDIIDNKEFK